MIPSVAKSASPSPISLPRDSKALNTASALLFAISSSPEPPGGGRGRYGGKTGRSSRRARTSPRNTG